MFFFAAKPDKYTRLILFRQVSTWKLFDTAQGHSFFYAGANVTFANVVGTSMGFSRFLSSNSKMYSIIAGMFQGAGDIFGLTKRF